MKQGDAVGYVKELKAGGYFTAPLDKYTKVVVRLVNEFKGKYDKLLAWTPPEPPKPVEPEPEPVLDPEPVLPEPEPEPVEVEPPPVIDEPAKPVTDLVPGDDVKKLNTIAKIFYKIWGFILKAIAYFKK